MNRARLLSALSLLAVVADFSACSNSDPNAAAQLPAGMTPAATPRAACGPGSRPETGLQGQVSAADHDSGRAAEGYTCNTEMVGSFTTPNAIGTVGGFKTERYVDKAGRECAYYDTTLLFPSNIFDTEAGVNVLDMSDPSKPVRSARLLTPAMDSPHESLVLNQKRGLLVAVSSSLATAPGIVDIYDLTQDCRNPMLKASAPVGLLGHESGISPDGNTFYAASFYSPDQYSVGALTAVDISNPMQPRPLTVFNMRAHGLTISSDGNRAYVAGAGAHKGLVILDTSQVQGRTGTIPTISQIGTTLTWDTISTPQNAIPITIKGRPYLVEIDEFGAQSRVGAGRIIDIADETKPVVISNLRLEVHDPANFAMQANDPGATAPFQGYAGHYCNVPTQVDPTIVACSMIVSGLRVFDIRDPFHPREVAYFNAPVNPRVVTQPSPASNYAMASPTFAPERKEIWYTDGHNGFYAVRVTNGAWPDNAN